MKVYVFLQVLRDLISISLLLLICNCVYSQNKYEINWVFGMNAGINFNDTSNPAAFKTFSNNNETNASVSNRDGELLFYISFKGSFPAGNPFFKILDSQGSLITNGDSLKSLGTCTNGVAIIPFSVDSDKFHIFHIGKIFFDGCGFPCYYLYYSIVQRQSNNEFEVISKNNLLMQHRIAERMALTKHSNGKDWWLAVTETENAISLPCTNKYYKFLIKNDSINGPFDQSIGAIQCNSASYIGEMTFSRSGSLLAVAKSGGGVHLMNFDRCDGLFYNYRHVDSSQAWFYGCEFSSNERFLYASEAKLGENLYQYDLHSPDIQGSKQLILSNSDTNLIIGQLQIAPDNKIYVGFDFGVSTPHYNTLKNYLSVINEPNLPGLSCGLDTFSFFLGDSSTGEFGLPNMPNYNLGPTSIYAADAGEDTVYCTNQGNGVTIGTLPVEHIIYEWYPSHHLSDTTIAQPIASPPKDTWYYLTVTDTSQTTSCQTRMDSVFVRVDSCVVGVEAYGSQHSVVRVYPNPARDKFKVSGLKFKVGESYELKVYDVLGRNLKMSKLENEQMRIDVSSLKSGMYFWVVEDEKGIIGAGKMVKQ